MPLSLQITQVLNSIDTFSLLLGLHFPLVFLFPCCPVFLTGHSSLNNPVKVSVSFAALVPHLSFSKRDSWAI